MIVTNKDKKIVQIDRFKLQKPLLHSGFGMLYHAKDIKKSQNSYVVKLLDNALDIHEIHAQVEALKLLNGSSLFAEAYLSKRVMNKFYIVYEAPDSFLNDLDEPMSESSACEMLLSLLKQLRYLHANALMVMGLDERVVINHKGHFSIASWAITKKSIELKEKIESLECRYYAPEHLGYRHYDVSDIYRLGAIFYKALGGRSMGEGDEQKEISKVLFRSKYGFVKQEPHISDKSYKLICWMMQKEIYNRPTIEQIEAYLAHPYSIDIHMPKEVVDAFESPLQRVYYLAQEGVGVAQKIYAEYCRSKEDYIQMQKWYLHACEHGSYDAKYELGVCYKNGIGCHVNLHRAYEIFLELSYYGHADAIYNLALMIEEGKAVYSDMKLAKRYYKKAAYFGSKKAYIKLKEFDE